MEIEKQGRDMVGLPFSMLQAKLCASLVNENKRLLKENQRLRAALKEERQAIDDDGEFVTENDLA